MASKPRRRSVSGQSSHIQHLFRGPDSVSVEVIVVEQRDKINSTCEELAKTLKKYGICAKAICMTVLLVDTILVIGGRRCVPLFIHLFIK